MRGGMELTAINQRFIEEAFSKALSPFWYRTGLNEEWWADFLRANEMGWTFSTTHHVGNRMYCASRDEATGWVDSFSDLLIEVMLKTSAECYDKPDIAALRVKGWKCKVTQWSHLTQAYCYNSDGRFEPLYVNADAAWAELVRRQA